MNKNNSVTATETKECDTTAQQPIDGEATEKDVISEAREHIYLNGLLHLYQYSSLDSSQDQARRLLEGNQKRKEPYLAVVTEEQTKGRGTSGREWISVKGNTFVTIAIPQTSIMSRRDFPVTLLPLKIGTIMASRTRDRLQRQSTSSSANSAVRLKWPNDVLINEKKVGGVLIESASDSASSYWLLIGIGINVGFAPEINDMGRNRGRPSTCIYCHSSSSLLGNENEEAVMEHQKEMLHEAQSLAVDLAVDIIQWVESLVIDNGESSSSWKLLDEWRGWVDWTKEVALRDEGEGGERRKGGAVLPVDIEEDGRLRVRDLNGKERLLVADYLY